MSRSYWIKPAKDTYAPTSIVCLCVGTTEKMIEGTLRVSESRFNHVCVVASKRRKGKWTDPIYLRFTNQDDFWAWLHSFGSAKRCTYVYSPIASNALTLLGFWQLIDTLGAVLTRKDENGTNPIDHSRMDEGPLGYDACPESSSESQPYQHGPAFRISNYVITGKVDILKYRVNGRSFAWASSKQYIDIDENILAKGLEFKWSSSIYSDENPAAIMHNSKDRSLLWLRFHQTLVDWWLSIDGGPWGQTLSQMGYSFWRKRIDPKMILAHGNSDACYVEELAAFGGRASVWCLAPIGDVGKWKETYSDFPPLPEYSPVQGPIVHIDVQSMYPSLLAEKEYPIQLLGVYRDVSLASLRDMLGEYAIIASVRLNCTMPEFPHRLNDRIVYPVGRFDSALSGPELELALAHNQIESVNIVNVYRKGRPFEAAARLLIDYRKQTRLDNHWAWELLVKQMSNAMSGKLAQRNDRWIPRPDIVPPISWGQFCTVDYETRISNVFRCIAGMALERVNASSAPRVLLSAYAYLTGYGRLLMHGLRKECQPSLVLSQDTDGLYIALREDVQEILKRMRKVAEPLTLRQSAIYNDGIWLSPSHYWLDGNWTLSGFQIVSVASSELRVVSERTSNPITLGVDHSPMSIRVIRDTRNLICARAEGVIDQNGWMNPMTVKDHYI